MKAILQRNPQVSELVTFGKLYLPWLTIQPILYTIELPWKNNQEGISCIPAGDYILKPYSSPKHENVWEYQNVSNRSYCLMHPANYACDVHIGSLVHKNELEGCTAVGFGVDASIPMITRSQEAMAYLRTTIGVNTTWEIEIRG